MNAPLSELATTVIPSNIRGMLVRDLWSTDRGWDFEQIMPYISDMISLRLRAVVLDTITGAEDRISWDLSPDGKFNVQSAYRQLTLNKCPQQQMSTLYEQIWKVVAPERNRYFLWLVAQQVIMTNMERLRRHLSDSGVCAVCNCGYETIMHVLRDCPTMKGIWTRLVPVRKRTTFFAQSLLEWMYSNLRISREVEGIAWSTLFAVAVWWSWKWRCWTVFGENRRCRDRVRFLKDQTKDIALAHELQGVRAAESVRVTRLISWTFPVGDWFKVNTDGASRGNPGLAATGGVMRDANENWCGGFSLNIGICSAPAAEL